MWGTLTVILLLLLLTFGVWHSITNSLFILIEKDMFNGETKTFVFKKNGKEKVLKIKKPNDALNALSSSRISSGSISYDPKREKGLHLVFSRWESGGVGHMTIIEMDGEKVIQEDEYNLEDKGLAPSVHRMIDLIERMSSTSSVWDEVSSDKA